MKVNLEQLEEMQKELFRQQCDLDIQKAMVKHFIKKKQAEQLTLSSVMLSAYYMIVDNEPTVVMAENIGDACDKLDELGVLEYEFVQAKSITIVH